MKKIISVISLVIAIGLLLPVCVFAGGDDTITTGGTPQGVEVSAKSAILMDSSTGKILYEKNCHEKIQLASVTKIMTLLLAMEKLERGEMKLDDMITTSTHASQMGGSQIWLKEGEQMSVHDILKATAVASANDASMALAEHIGSSETEFVRMMNERAAELGMKDTVFVNPTGLDAEGHYSCSYDIAIMTMELLKHKVILDYTKIWMDNLRGGKTELVNTNKLIRFYKGATGMKTGTTNGAGSCISATATRGDMSLISVVMGCATSNDRFDDAKRLLDYGFSNFAIYKPATKSEGLPTIKVTNGIDQFVTLKVKIDASIIVPSTKLKTIKEEIKLEEEVKAPVKAGQKLGMVKICVDENLTYTYDIVAECDIGELTFSSSFYKLFKTLVSI